MCSMTSTSVSPSSLILCLVLIVILLGKARLLDAAPTRRSTDKKAMNATQSGRSVSKRDYSGLPANIGTDRGDPIRGAFWMTEDGELTVQPLTVRTRRILMPFDKDLARSTWHLLESRNNPDDAITDTLNAQDLQGSGKDLSIVAQGGSEFPIFKEKPFRKSVIESVPQMIKRLGRRNYDANLTHFRRPREAWKYPNGRVIYKAQGHRKVPTFVREIVRQFARTFYDGSHQANHLNRKTRRSLRKFLSFHTACPIKYQWKDYGPKFWPRWVKTARCHKTGYSCSIPPGMKCRPHRQKKVMLLRYICLQSWNRHRCGWKPLELSVLQSCKCGCV